MSRVVEVRLLSARDVRGGFKSKDHHLDSFFKKHALNNQIANTSTTWIALCEGKIAGYVTLTSVAIPPKELSTVLTDLPPYPTVPALLIARMATDRAWQGQRLIGPALFRGAIYPVMQCLLGSVGCVGIKTDAKAGAEKFYARNGFVTLPSPDEGASATTPMFLATAVALAQMAAAQDGDAPPVPTASTPPPESEAHVATRPRLSLVTGPPQSAPPEAAAAEDDGKGS